MSTNVSLTGATPTSQRTQTFPPLQEFPFNPFSVVTRYLTDTELVNLENTNKNFIQIQ